MAHQERRATWKLVSVSCFLAMYCFSTIPTSEMDIAKCGISCIAAPKHYGIRSNGILMERVGNLFLNYRACRKHAGQCLLVSCLRWVKFGPCV